MAGCNTFSKNEFTLFISHVDNYQYYITAQVKDEHSDPVKIYTEIYCTILEFIIRENLCIIQERIFGSLKFFSGITQIRKDLLHEKKLNTEVPFTYIEGQPYWGEGIAGIQITAISNFELREQFWTIYDNDIPCGYGWKRNNATFLFLQNIYDLRNDNKYSSREKEASNIFDKAEKILRNSGASYYNAVRTWIYKKYT